MAASAHGILATGEYLKLGASSTATAGAIGRLIGDVDARSADGQGRGEPVKSLAPLVPEVRAFWNLVTSEATGWQATLRDKNVPLPQEASMSLTARGQVRARHVEVPARPVP